MDKFAMIIFMLRANSLNCIRVKIADLRSRKVFP